ncbi:MAG: 30S ribosomal protein S7 [Nitrospirae bacterium]|nr:30S ribosomal protein S7 [Nitrospirota bacterium]MBI3359223.1 30S ribosomal protein S7 [Candidatus Troglogloeales bacterium]
MSRRRLFLKKEVVPDAQFKSKLVAKMVGIVTKQGKRSIAESICYGAFDLIKQKSGSDPVEVFKTAIDRIKPSVEVKSRRVGGASYQVPIEVRSDRRVTLGLRWLILYAKQRSGKSMREKLAAEILDASNNTGGAVKKREDTHRMAEANKAFAHYRW